MAKTKRNSSVNQPITTGSSKQVVYKIRWREHRGGGHERIYELDDIGEDKLRLAKEEEVKPNTRYYLVDPSRPNVFYETFFHEVVSWETILEFVSTNKIYIRYAEDKRKEEGPRVRVDSPRLF